MFADFTINGNTFGPTGWSVSPPHHISWKEFDTSEQATHATHVIVTIAPYLVVKILQNEHFIVKWLEWLKNGFMLKVFTGFVRPELVRDRTIGTEHHNQPLLGCRFLFRFSK